MTFDMLDIRIPSTSIPAASIPIRYYRPRLSNSMISTTKHSRYNTRLINDITNIKTPGPGAYDCRLPASNKSIKIPPTIRGLDNTVLTKYETKFNGIHHSSIAPGTYDHKSQFTSATHLDRPPFNSTTHRFTASVAIDNEASHADTPQTPSTGRHASFGITAAVDRSILINDTPYGGMRDDACRRHHRPTSICDRLIVAALVGIRCVQVSDMPRDVAEACRKPVNNSLYSLAQKRTVERHFRVSGLSPARNRDELNRRVAVNAKSELRNLGLMPQKIETCFGKGVKKGDGIGRRTSLFVKMNSTFYPGPGSYDLPADYEKKSFNNNKQSIFFLTRSKRFK